MALKISLKPKERMIIGGAVVTNTGSTSQLTIENNVPLLREKDILGEKEAQTPATRVYFAIQLMYIDERNITVHHDTYWKLVREFLEAAPRSKDIVDKISKFVVAGKYYPALKKTKELIAFEQEVLSRV